MQKVLIILNLRPMQLRTVPLYDHDCEVVYLTVQPRRFRVLGTTTLRLTTAAQRERFLNWCTTISAQALVKKTMSIHWPRKKDQAQCYGGLGTTHFPLSLLVSLKLFFKMSTKKKQYLSTPQLAKNERKAIDLEIKNEGDEDANIKPVLL